MEVGQDLVLMFGGNTSKQAGGERAGRRVRLQLDDVESIRETVPLVAAISPEMMMGGMTRAARARKLGSNMSVTKLRDDFGNGTTAAV